MLTLLSYGGGQDSFAILGLLAHDENFRRVYAPESCLSVFSDTGNEHLHTYNHMRRVAMPLFQKAAINFTWLEPSMGFHSEAWKTLTHFYETHNAIGCKAYPKSCTDNLKIQPIYRWVAKMFEDAGYGAAYGKHSINNFVEEQGKIRVLIGFAKGEESRQSDNTTGPIWMQKGLEKRYPLIEIGWNRERCQQFMEDLGYEVPYPSNCRFCPYMDEMELLWLWRFDNAGYNYLCELERRKVEFYKDKIEPKKNFGIWGKPGVMLSDALKNAQARYPYITDEQLNDHKFSHGHCVKSKY